MIPVPNPVQAAPDALDFGDLALGGRLTRIVNLRNTSVNDIVFAEAVVQGAPGAFSVSDVFTTECTGEPRAEPNVLKQAGCTSLKVTFAPLVVGLVEDVLVINFRNDEHPQVEVPLRGVGVAPRIRVCLLDANGALVEDACTKSDGSSVSQPTLDFGPVPFGESAIRKVRVVNLASVPFELAGVDIAPEHPQFKRLTPGPLPTIPGGGSADFEFEFTPRSDGESKALLVVTPSEASLAITLDAKGSGNGPRICLTPAAGLVFGDIPVGEARLQTVTIQNCGLVRYRIDRLELTSDSGIFTFAGGDVPDLPFDFGQGSEIRLHVTYTPSVVRSDAGKVFVKAKYDENGVTWENESEVTFAGSGKAPDCARRKPVANAGADMTIEPLRQANLDGSLSRAPFGSITYDWRLVEQPSGANATLEGATSPLPTLETPVAGEYLVTLVVADRYGCRSEPDSAVVRAVPRSRLFVELTWEEAHSDLDLHLVGPGGTFGTAPGDAWWRNASPDWSAATALTGDGNRANDPMLLGDATWGRGPESIVLGNAGNAGFEVWVANMCDRPFVDGAFGSSQGPVTATLRVWENGRKALEVSQSLARGERWHAGSIAVSHDGAQIAATASEDELVPETSSDVCPGDQG